jgi:pimeloyl-ACP methyl ester carboxylesterase
MLKHTGLPVKDFKISNIIIDDQGNYIHTIEVGDKKNQTLVLLHGYGGSGIIFWKIIKELASKYYLILVDIIGMGASS